MEKQFIRNRFVKVGIVPTYKCPLHNLCDYCYALEQSKNYNDMDPDLLQKILSWLSELKTPIDLKILGGEPTSYPYFSKFLQLLDLSPQLHPFIYTNGLFTRKICDIMSKSEKISEVTFHYEPAIIKKNKFYKKFFRNVDTLFDSGKQITFRYNAVDFSFDYSPLINLAIKYNAKIIYSFSAPSATNKQSVSLFSYRDFLPQLEKFINNAINNEIYIKSSRPFPACIFPKEKKRFFLEKGNIPLQCTPYPSINPDGSLLMCSVLLKYKTEPILTKERFYSTIERVMNIAEEVKCNIPTEKECEKCQLFISKECQGGCLAYKEEKVDVDNLM